LVGVLPIAMVYWAERMDSSVVKDLSGIKLIVAGEVGIDEYLWGNCHRISPEAPVPVVEILKEESRLGLAGNVAQNICSLGASPNLISVCGVDRNADTLKQMVKDCGITESFFLEDTTRPTLRKTRVIAQKQHIVRVDHERAHALPAHLAKQFTERICDSLAQADGIILQDYAKGVWNADTMAFIRHAKQIKKPVFVDPNRSTPLSLYRGATLMTPNLIEAEILSRRPAKSPYRAELDSSELKNIAAQLLEEAELDHAIITCSEHGMVSLSKRADTLTHIPTFARDVADVTGAGDTVIAVIALAMCAGLALNTALQIANAAAGLVVGQMGAVSVTPKELQDELERLKDLRILMN